MNTQTAAREVFLEWTKRRINVDLAEDPTMYWHYTSGIAVKGILCSNRIWATHAGFLNDSREMKHGLEVAAECLRELDVTGLSTTCRKVVDASAELASPSRFEKSFPEGVYVACFSTNGDQLSQWRAYTGASKDDGYALGFEPRGAGAIWAHLAPGNHGLMFRRVIYDISQQRADCARFFHVMFDFLDQDPRSDERKAATLRYLQQGILELTASFKNMSFSEESEWRVMYFPNLAECHLEIRHRVVDGVIVPYVELDLPKQVGAMPTRLPVSFVRCGPAAHPRLKREGAQGLLNFGGLQQVHVDQSKIPLR